ncbi:MAG: DEAD/DEAH box helicase [Halobacteriaceae archaeon]
MGESRSTSAARTDEAGSDGDGADAFATLGDDVRAALSERGFTTPTEPQRRAIPTIADGEDALVVAPTGTGKTETAMLPILDAVAGRPARERDGFQALYVTPLRALNRDMRERLEWWGEALDVAIDVRHGDTTQYHRRKQATDPPDVLVTTPETLQAMLTGERLREGLADVEHVVVDEVHELAASKRGAQLAVALERLRALAGPFQRVGLSATVGDPGEVGAFLTGDRGCAVVEVDVRSLVEFEVVHPTVGEGDERLADDLLCDAELASHVRTIAEIVDENESTLVFVNTRQTAEALGSRFTAHDDGPDIAVHHGSLAKAARVEVEDAFKAGDLDALLCTSSLELGIDVGRVDHVVQYGSPRQVKRLLQRVGRAGHRRDRVSRGTLVVGHTDDALESMVIARRAAAGQVEPAPIHEGSLDVVANQVAGMVQGTGGVTARAAYEVTTRAHPFRHLDEEAFRQVVREVSGNRLVWLEEEADRLEPSGTFQYVYDNLSMIPDEETYEVSDMASGSTVGSLDERFVVNFAEPGATFIQGGRMWRIAEVDEEETRVKATPVEDPAGEVPSWTGEEIPVPAPVAQEVAELRRIAAAQLADGASREAVARDLAGRYPADVGTVRRALERLERHVEAGVPVPTDERLVIEGADDTLVVNAAYGHRTNEALGRALAALLGQQTGSSVGMEVDPYRIELSVPREVAAEDAAAVLTETDPDHLDPLLRLALERSDALQFTLAQVAAKFGALKRWRGGDISPSRLVAALEDTPVFEEAVRAVFHNDLDVDRAADVLRAVQAGELTVAVVGGHTPVGRGGQSSGQELLAPDEADAGVVDAVRERLLDSDVRLVCVHCADWERERTVERVADQPECPRCNSTRVAALSPWADETVTALRQAVRGDAGQDAMDDETRRLVQRAHRNASLVQGHGKKAVIALRARGVGPENAARIINRHREDEADFYRDVLEREREYARTKAFWD